MAARTVTSVISGSLKLLFKVYYAMRKGRKMVKRGSEAFYETLVENGVPKKEARELAKTFKSTGEEVLSIRKFIRLASKYEVV